MKIISCSSNLPLSLAIKFGTFSKWSHVAVICKDNEKYAIEATPGFKPLGIPDGVKISKVEDIKRKHSKFEVIDFWLPHEDKAFEFGYRQIGKGYDWSYYAGVVFQRNWQDENKWVCSENVMAMMMAGGFNLLRPESLRRIVPEHIHMFNPNCMRMVAG